MTNSTREHDEDGTERYRAIEYGSNKERVTIIQDSENEKAWIQSDYTLEVCE